MPQKQPPAPIKKEEPESYWENLKRSFREMQGGAGELIGILGGTRRRLQKTKGALDKAAQEGGQKTSKK